MLSPDTPDSKPGDKHMKPRAVLLKQHAGGQSMEQMIPDAAPSIAFPMLEATAAIAQRRKYRYTVVIVTVPKQLPTLVSTSSAELHVYCAVQKIQKRRTKLICFIIK
jgi:hypothetical protein